MSVSAVPPSTTPRPPVQTEGAAKQKGAQSKNKLTLTNVCIELARELISIPVHIPIFLFNCLRGFFIETPQQGKEKKSIQFHQIPMQENPQATPPQPLDPSLSAKGVDFEETEQNVIVHAWISPVNSAVQYPNGIGYSIESKTLHLINNSFDHQNSQNSYPDFSMSIPLPPTINFKTPPCTFFQNNTISMIFQKQTQYYNSPTTSYTQANYSSKHTPLNPKSQFLGSDSGFAPLQKPERNEQHPLSTQASQIPFHQNSQHIWMNIPVHLNMSQANIKWSTVAGDFIVEAKKVTSHSEKPEQVFVHSFSWKGNLPTQLSSSEPHAIIYRNGILSAIFDLKQQPPVKKGFFAKIFG